MYGDAQNTVAAEVEATWWGSRSGSRRFELNLRSASRARSPLGASIASATVQAQNSLLTIAPLGAVIRPVEASRPDRRGAETLRPGAAQTATIATARRSPRIQVGHGASVSGSHDFSIRTGYLPRIPANHRWRCVGRDRWRRESRTSDRWPSATSLPTGSLAAGAGLASCRLLSSIPELNTCAR